MNDTLGEVEKVDRYDPGEPVKLQTSHYLGKNSQPDLNIEMCKA